MSRLARILLPGAAVVVAFAALWLSLSIGGGANAPALGDPGELVRYGLPAAKLVVDFSLATVIGAFVLALWSFSSTDAAYRKAIDLAAGAAVTLTVAAALTGFLSFLNVTLQPVSLGQTFGDQLFFFFTQIGLGQAWLAVTIIAAAVSVLSVAVTNQTALFFVGLLGAGAIVPIALQGHAAGLSGHGMAITSIGLHILFISVWFGGIIALVILRRKIPLERLQAVTARFSTLAIVAFIVVAVSGVANAALRIGTWSNLLGSSYGQLVILKVVALVALGIAGVMQRNFFMRRMGTSPAGSSGNKGSPGNKGSSGIPDQQRIRRAFWWLIGIELLILSFAAGIAAGLARTATPVTLAPSTTPTPAQILTGELLPPELTFERYFTTWRFDLIWMLVCGFGIFFYLVGVWRLHRRGDKWPWYRSVLWVAGLLLLFYITNGGVNAYEMYLFSAHMGAHMTLGMMVPILLVPGAPVTLAMRAIEKRTDGSRGGREWILKAVHSGYANVISHPIFATINFVGSLWLFYYTPIFRWATQDHIGHEWMIVHFLLAGYLFVQSLIGIDPVRTRYPYPFRILQLLLAMTVHAFFGLSIMMGEGLLLADWYGAMGRIWGSPPLADQQQGGAIAWSVGEIPNFILAMVIAIQWSRSDAKEAKRKDRQADRDEDAELRAYNEMLARQAQRDTAGQ